MKRWISLLAVCILIPAGSFCEEADWSLETSETQAEQITMAQEAPETAAPAAETPAVPEETPAVPAEAPDAPAETPYPGAREMLLADVDDRELLEELLPKLYDELPEQKKKK